MFNPFNKQEEIGDEPIASEEVSKTAIKPGKWDDMVNHPPHYTKGSVECLKAIKEALGDIGFKSYIKGNVIKYLWREEHKGKDEDIKKALYYLNEYFGNNKNI